MGTTTVNVIESVREAYKTREVKTPEEVYEFLKARLRELMSGGGGPELLQSLLGPTVILVVGVNGSGKTTSIAKLGFILSRNNKKVIVAACDTFRAAAVEQLSIWAERIGVQIVKHQTGADPAAVAFDACEAASARNADYLILDTAGRLHTQKDLMRELTKIRDVVARKIPGAPNEVLLVLDATTGQNALSQAQLFNEALGVTAIALTKLDGTAKGGMVVSIVRTLRIPLKYIGVGEKIEDLQNFDPEQFVNALL